MKTLYQAMVLMAVQSCFAAVAQAGTALYKSVDQQGRVTFSDAPVAGDQVEKVTVEDAGANVLSSASTQQLIKEQQDADRRSAAKKNTVEESWSERYQQAQLSVEQAERELQSAQTIQEGDMVGNALGGARPNARWIERLEQAEADLQARNAELDQLRRQR